YWFETPRPVDNHHLHRRSQTQAYGSDAWPGFHVRSAAQPGTHLWHLELSLAESHCLGDHRVKGKAVLPAAAYLQIALAAAAEVFGNKSHELEQVTFKEALIVSEHETLTAQLVISPNRPGAPSFKFYSLDANGSLARLHASGTIRIGENEEVGYFAA